MGTAGAGSESGLLTQLTDLCVAPAAFLTAPQGANLVRAVKPGVLWPQADGVSIPTGRQGVTLVMPLFTAWVWAGLPEWPAEPPRAPDRFPGLHLRLSLQHDPASQVCRFCCARALWCSHAAASCVPWLSRSCLSLLKRRVPTPAHTSAADLRVSDNDSCVARLGFGRAQAQQQPCAGAGWQRTEPALRRYTGC